MSAVGVVAGVVAGVWPARLAPEPAGAAGLALALLLILVLSVRQVRADYKDHRPPGPVPTRRPAWETEATRLYWISSSVLVAALAVVVVERVVVLT